MLNGDTRTGSPDGFVYYFCVFCGRWTRSPESKAGRTDTCGECGQIQAVPRLPSAGRASSDGDLEPDAPAATSSESVVYHVCRFCGLRTKSERRRAGKLDKCQMCGRMVTVPGLRSEGRISANSDPGPHEGLADATEGVIYHICKFCGLGTKSQASMAGKTDTCRVCGKVVPVPSREGERQPESMGSWVEPADTVAPPEIKWSCPNCRNLLRCGQADTGKELACPFCGRPSCAEDELQAGAIAMMSSLLHQEQRAFRQCLREFRIELRNAFPDELKQMLWCFSHLELASSGTPLGGMVQTFCDVVEDELDARVQESGWDETKRLARRGVQTAKAWLKTEDGKSAAGGMAVIATLLGLGFWLG
jgi:hypothetical protein